MRGPSDTGAAAAAESGARERILAAAGKRFESFGYRRTGIAEIARDAGLAAGTVYRYFKGKEEVFLAVIARLNERWLAVGRAAVAGPGTALERLGRLGAASVQFNLDNALFLAILRKDTEILFAPVAERVYEDFVRNNVRLIADVIRTGIAEGTFRAVDADRAAFILFCAGNHLSMQPFHPYAELLPLFEEIVNEGLVTPAARRLSKRRARR